MGFFADVFLDRNVIIVGDVHCKMNSMLEVVPLLRYIIVALVDDTKFAGLSLVVTDAALLKQSWLGMSMA